MMTDAPEPTRISLVREDIPLLLVSSRRWCVYQVAGERNGTPALHLDLASGRIHHLTLENVRLYDMF